ncbi:LysM-repeat protein [Indibacter alkaliphilus LW1]|uniref:LysM-repeat protein n=1 Tax=Indibacter alkaliphilus (strain CCUG 57479 / KCTC 22604 / LW1) TaxID=1189612 RepID=S2DHU9_INDAL|nr:ABC transporter substrate-binding protein [Indibacter alkaliphilus]EOZ96750.1 LysM-repeat protein [Indibacter alkaliphilus LW1]
MRQVFLLLLFVFTFFVQSSAQDELREYERAKTLIGYGNYGEAMELLKPFMERNQYGQLSNYAKYNYAMAALKSENYALAQTTLKDLVGTGSWVKSEDAKYLLAIAFFEEGKNKEALQVINSIKEAEIKRQAENASFNFLKEAPLDFLLGNVKEFNDNSGFMLALKAQLDRKTILSSEERDLYNEARNIGLEGGTKADGKNGQELDIALVLPFNYSGGSGVRSLNSSNFVLELYQGIIMGVEQLKKSGVAVNIKTFDTERNMERIKEILADPYFRQADAIIGPIYPDETELVMNFAETNKIPYINPLSNIDDRFQGMNYAYLFRPSVASIADGVVEFARKNINGKKIAIAYSSSLRDEQLSTQIQETSRKFGFEIVKSQKVSGREINEFFNGLDLRYDSAAKADMVVLLADDPNIGATALGFLESQNVSTPILVMDSWLFFNFANYEMLLAENLYFIGNNTIKLDSKPVASFREKYFQLFVGYPSFNTHLGYELIQWIGETINQSDGFDLRRNLDRRGFREGKLFYGFDFSKSHHNKYVPVLKLEQGKLELKQ